MKWWLFFSLSIFLLSLKVLLFPAFEILTMRPDFFIILMVYISLRSQMMEAFIASWWLGFFSDITFGGEGGIFTLLFSLTSLILSKFREGIFKESILTKIVLVFICCLQCNIIYSVILWLLYPDSDIDNLFIKVMLGAIYTTVISPVLFYTFEWMELVKEVKK